MRAITMYRPNVNRNVFENAFGDAAKLASNYLDAFFNDRFFNESADKDGAHNPFESRLFGFGPAVDISESGESYLVEADLPGFSESDIAVHVDGRTVTIESKQDEAAEKEKKADEKAKSPRYLLRERHIGHFSRSFTLPENADTEQVSANFTGGVLRLTIKKKTETKKRVVQINGVGASLSQ